MNIGRTLFWFGDGDETLTTLDDFFELGTLLNRLLNEVYDGKKIKFINLYFRTEETYQNYPQTSKDFAHFYGGYLSYDGVWNRSQFDALSAVEQIKYAWDTAYQY